MNAANPESELVPIEPAMEFSSSSACNSTWAWDEADEIAFVLREEQAGGRPLERRSSLKNMLHTSKRTRQRHVPHALFYPFALTAW